MNFAIFTRIKLTRRQQLSMTQDERFWSYVLKTDGCWLWLGAQRNKEGYGCFQVNGRAVAAHRWSFVRLRGALPPGFEPDHLCRVHACVRPDHMEAVPKRVNVLRSECPPALNARRTHCVNGHLLDAENTYIVPGRTSRHCRRCHSELTRRRYHERRRAAGFTTTERRRAAS